MKFPEKTIILKLRDFLLGAISIIVPFIRSGDAVTTEANDVAELRRLRRRLRMASNSGGRDGAERASPDLELHSPVYPPQNFSRHPSLLHTNSTHPSPSVVKPSRRAGNEGFTLPKAEYVCTRSSNHGSRSPSKSRWRNSRRRRAIATSWNRSGRFSPILRISTAFPNIGKSQRLKFVVTDEYLGGEGSSLGR
ncbi:unnamed protein product [Linum trigynum]|uniref:Uncharacterized protein n=1 Tax=Linum trigynum TaxID=586398 RepID=A0AAV2CJ15_9ROSI